MLAPLGQHIVCHAAARFGLHPRALARRHHRVGDETLGHVRFDLDPFVSDLDLGLDQSQAFRRFH